MSNYNDAINTIKNAPYNAMINNAESRDRWGNLFNKIGLPQIGGFLNGTSEVTASQAAKLKGSSDDGSFTVNNTQNDALSVIGDYVMANWQVVAIGFVALLLLLRK